MEMKGKYEVPLLLKLVLISMKSYLRDFPVDLDRASRVDFLCQFDLHCCIWNPCCSRHTAMSMDIYRVLHLVLCHCLQFLALVIYDQSLQNWNLVGFLRLGVQT